MAKVLEVSANATDIFGRAIEKRVDVTEHCPSLKLERRLILTYTRNNHYRIVEILCTYPGQDKLGVSQSYYLAELERGTFAEHFNLWSERQGPNAADLSELIFEHAPAI